jgi:hypothetical protein
MVTTAQPAATQRTVSLAINYLIFFIMVMSPRSKGYEENRRPQM